MSTLTCSKLLGGCGFEGPTAQFHCGNAERICRQCLESKAVVRADTMEPSIDVSVDDYPQPSQAAHLGGVQYEFNFA